MGKCIRLEKQLRAQRAELRRFNREAKARAEGRGSVLRDTPHMIPLSQTFYVDQAQGDSLKVTIDRARGALVTVCPFGAGDRVRCTESQVRHWVGATGTIVRVTVTGCGFWVPDDPECLTVLSYADSTQFERTRDYAEVSSPQRLLWIRDRDAAAPRGQGDR